MSWVSATESYTDGELERLLFDPESHLVERKESLSGGEVKKKVRQAICAFANDFPDEQKPGVLFIGARDPDGSPSGISIDDSLLLKLANIRDEGDILPIPTITVSRRNLRGNDYAVVIVFPSLFPPVRYKGAVWIRTGPSRRQATVEEEMRLTEKRRSNDLPFDLQPFPSASIGDLNVKYFTDEYLPNSVSHQALDKNSRSVQQQMASLHFITSDVSSVPTSLGLLVAGNSPSDFIPGAYIQFLRFESVEMEEPIKDSREIHGPIGQQLDRIEDLFNANNARIIRISGEVKHVTEYEYPKDAFSQLVRNAIMHRSYNMSNAPTKVHWFSDRIEIISPGGPYGMVKKDNFGQPGMTDYRNPNLATAFKNLGYVEMFGMGLQLARKSMAENGNPELELQVNESFVIATMRRRS